MRENVTPRNADRVYGTPSFPLPRRSHLYIPMQTSSLLITNQYSKVNDVQDPAVKNKPGRITLEMLKSNAIGQTGMQTEAAKRDVIDCYS